jgi:hypothetical protein
MDLYEHHIKTRRFDLQEVIGHADEVLMQEIKQLVIDKLG